MKKSITFIILVFGMIIITDTASASSFKVKRSDKIESVNLVQVDDMTAIMEEKKENERKLAELASKKAESLSELNDLNLKDNLDLFKNKISESSSYEDVEEILSEAKSESEKNDKTDKEAEEKAKKEEEESKHKEEMSNREFNMPLSVSYTLSSGFGYRNDPTGASGNSHDGIDLACPQGSEIYASRAGTVVAAEFHWSAGNHVIIKHDNGYYTYYMHMTNFNTSVGSKVNAGDVIGYVGSTGNSTGAHLHFGISTALWSGFKDPGPFLGLY